MAKCGVKWEVMRNMKMVLLSLMLVLAFASGQKSIKSHVFGLDENETDPFSSYILKAMDFSGKTGRSAYQHVWPEMKLGWEIIVGSLIGFLGAAFGSVGGVGGGGIFVPMLILILGFDPKSATAISKCMIMGAAISTVYFNLRLKHPTLDMPIIDYDLVLLIQPILMLGISIGVCLSVIFADWMVTLLLIILFIGTSIKAFYKGLDTWKKETIIKQVAAKLLESSATVSGEAEYKPLPGGAQNETRKLERSILDNIYWKEFGLLSFVWLAYLALQIAKTYTAACSITFWIVNLLQVPVSVGVFLYQAVGLYQGWRSISSKGYEGTNWALHHIVLSSVCALLAGIVGGLLGIGGGFVMGPLFLELGIPPQVASATATFGMTFSASISVVQYYILNRFPVPYALYLTIVAAIAAYVGQHIMNKLVAVFGRASLIIFVLSFTIFVSAFALGGVGISDTIGKIQRNEYMGFQDFCKYEA